MRKRKLAGLIVGSAILIFLCYLAYDALTYPPTGLAAHEYSHPKLGIAFRPPAGWGMAEEINEYHMFVTLKLQEPLWARLLGSRGIHAGIVVSTLIMDNETLRAGGYQSWEEYWNSPLGREWFKFEPPEGTVWYSQTWSGEFLNAQAVEWSFIQYTGAREVKCVRIIAGGIDNFHFQVDIWIATEYYDRLLPTMREFLAGMRRTSA